MQQGLVAVKAIDVYAVIISFFFPYSPAQT
jgi:hypothetical protein